MQDIMKGHIIGIYIYIYCMYRYNTRCSGDVALEWIHCATAAREYNYY